MILNIGSRIKNLRKQRKICQQDLCGKLITRTILSRIENNKMTPSIAQLEYISQQLNVPISFFFTEPTYNDTDISPGKNSHNSSILQEWYINKLYGHIIKLVELEPEKFDAIEDFNKYFYLGASFFTTGQINKAIKPLKKHINNFIKSPDIMQKENIFSFACALNILFAIMMQNKNTDKAEHYLILAKKHLTNYDATASRINFIIHSNLGVLYINSNQYEKTIKVLEDFLQTNKLISYQDLIPHIHLSLNIAYYNIGEFEKSIDHVKKAIFLYEYTGDFSFSLGCTLNHINALRYNKKFKEAFDVLEEFKLKVPDYEKNHPQFLIQEMILHFNTAKYTKALKLAEEIKLNKVNKLSKANYYFILGHINFLNNKYDEAQKYLLMSEIIFINENFSYDLAALYKDLYVITGDKTYKNKSEEHGQIRGRKNIFT